MDYFYNPDISSGGLQLNEIETRHCIRVLRKKPGDRIIIIDGKGGTYTCTLTKTLGEKAEYEVIEKQLTHPPPYNIHIAIAPTKNIERIEWFIEKSIEIGIQEVSFIYCENSERKQINQDRILKKVISSLKQSQNLYMPVIGKLVSFEDFIMNADPDSLKLICHADWGKDTFLLDAVEKGMNYQVVIGPEGDFTRKELIMAEKDGFKPVSLGPTRLRTETAGLVACILLNALNTKV